jgi:hypothetical protein
MSTPQLHRQLLDQLSQWIVPKDRRHLKNCAEIVAAILQSESACLAHWIPYLTHRGCQARAQMQRLSYFIHNPAICQKIFYLPLVKHFLQDWKGQELLLVMDTANELKSNAASVRLPKSAESKAIVELYTY